MADSCLTVVERHILFCSVQNSPMPKCDVCGYESDTKRGLGVHKATHDDGPKQKTYECEHCGEQFKDYISRRETRGREKFFCSKECNISFQEKEKFTFECATCGDEVVRSPSLVDEMGEYDINNHFCDKECESEYKSREWVGENHPSWVDNEVEESCDECGERIEVNEYYLDKQDHFFCSKECHDLHQTGETHADCDWCGERFELTARQRSTKTDRSFCTHNCYRLWLSEFQTGEKNPAWEGGKPRHYGPNWHSSRRNVLERDDEKCQGCAMTRDEHYEKYGRDLNVHHITPLREYDGDFASANELDNLITLCTQCHVEAEHEDLESVGAIAP